MYFTQLPDHNRPGFDEGLHFSRFSKQNIVFNALGTQGGCDNHVGCLSFKTVLSGKEEYGIDGRHIAVRPGQFLILNDDQPYSCRIQGHQPAKIVSVFFKKEFAGEVFSDATGDEATSLDNPQNRRAAPIEFFQTLYAIDAALDHQLAAFIKHLDTHPYNKDATDEYLIFFLRHLIQTHRSELTRAERVKALKPTTRKEIFKRLCIAKDLLHTSYHQPLDLETLSATACLSIPQLVRQFRAAFHTTPHRYLVRLRLDQAARLLATTALPIRDITWQCGFEDPSAFARAFKSAYKTQPETFRKRSPKV